MNLFKIKQNNTSVDVYRNLNTGKLSIKSRRKQDYGRVIGYAQKVYLKEVKFIVQPEGRKRVLKENRKNVHAFARGKICLKKEIPHEMCRKSVTYNPYKYESFVYSDSKEPISESDFAVICVDEGIFVI